MHFNDIPKFPFATYSVDVDWTEIGEWVRQQEEDRAYTIELSPDYQRGHVWTEDKQIKYVEYILRGGFSSKDLFFNCPGWMNDFRGPLQLVDGKQRYEAVRRFMNNEIRAFDHYLDQFEGRLRSTSCRFKIHVNNLETRAEVLQWYLDLNDGGVVHSDVELNRVRDLLLLEQ